MNKNHVLITVGAIMLLGATAAIASYATRASMQPETAPEIVQETPAPSKAKVVQAPRQQAAPQQQAAAPQQPACNDGNIVGTLAGGAAGGLLGNQIGKGKGKTVATIGGAVGGAVVGQRYIPTQNVTCR